MNRTGAGYLVVDDWARPDDVSASSSEDTSFSSSESSPRNDEAGGPSSVERRIFPLCRFQVFSLRDGFKWMFYKQASVGQHTGGRLQSAGWMPAATEGTSRRVPLP